MLNERRCVEVLERMILKLVYENHGVCVLDAAGSD